MKGHPSWKRFVPGSSHWANVSAAHIWNSEPCNKENCMVSRAVIGHLLEMYGEKFKVRSTDHGLILDLHGRRITFLFVTKTTKNIYNYDKAYEKTKSFEKAYKAVRPFRAGLIVESNEKIFKAPTMSEETKRKLAAHRKKKRQEGGAESRRATRDAVRRELSM